MFRLNDFRNNFGGLEHESNQGHIASVANKPTSNSSCDVLHMHSQQLAVYRVCCAQFKQVSELLFFRFVILFVCMCAV